MNLLKSEETLLLVMYDYFKNTKKKQQNSTMNIGKKKERIKVYLKY